MITLLPKKILEGELNPFGFRVIISLIPAQVFFFNILTISNEVIMVVILFANFEQLGDLVPIKLIFS